MQLKREYDAILNHLNLRNIRLKKETRNSRNKKRQIVQKNNRRNKIICGEERQAKEGQIHGSQDKRNISRRNTDKDMEELLGDETISKRNSRDIDMSSSNTSQNTQTFVKQTYM